jgi:WD40 repeat protein
MLTGHSQYVGQKFTPKDCPTIWGAAARPSTFTPSPGLANTVAATWSEHLAVAASNSMLLFTRSQDRAWNSQTPVKSLDTDILALEWISYTTVALGCRNGNIRLYDTRSGGSSHILTHPTPVSKLKRADDETRLICSGLEDTLFLYDLRAPRLSRSSSKQTFNYDNHHYNEEYFKRIYPTHRDGKKRRKLNHKAFKNWSQPVLTFEHANREYLELAIDVHPRLGLLAAAQDATTDTAIRISNIWTGRTVKEIKNEDSCPHSIKSLKFIDRYDDVDDGADLWSCWKGGLAKFGWGHGYGEKRPSVCTD